MADKKARKHKWIKGAIKHPGALHRALNVPEGKKIPEAKLEQAAHSKDPTMRKRAALAKTLKGFHHGGSQKAEKRYQKVGIHHG